MSDAMKKPVLLDESLYKVMQTLAEHELPEDRRLGQADGGTGRLISDVLLAHVRAKAAQLKKIADDKLEAELAAIKAADKRYDEAQRG